MFQFAQSKSLFSIYILILTVTKDVSLEEQELNVKENNVHIGFDFTEDEMAKFKLWSRGHIPYYIDRASYDKVLRDKIRNYLEEVNDLGSVEFQELPTPPPDTKTRWVLFTNRQGSSKCGDYTTKDFSNNGVQKVVLGYDLSANSGIAGAILAIIGVPPQHISPDRDDYISVRMNNIVPDKQSLFTKLENKEWLFHDLPYDFSSAGHYHFHKYTANGKATIVPKKSVNGIVGDYNDFSEIDLIKIQMLYEYISRNTNDNLLKQECLKLFSPGKNFSRYQPISHYDIGSKIQPMRKPEEYTGIFYSKNLNKKDSQETYDNGDKIAEPEGNSMKEPMLDEKTNLRGTNYIRPLSAGRYGLTKWYNLLKEKRSKL